MDVDIRDRTGFLEALDLCTRFRKPGSGLLIDAADINPHPSSGRAYFTGVAYHELKGLGTLRIGEIDLSNGAIRIVSHGPSTDKSPKVSPDGKSVAFLSDRSGEGDFQLYLWNVETEEVTAAPRVEGWVEYYHWSPDGKKILLGVAGRGADLSGGQGAIASKREDSTRPSWIPELQQGNEDFRWRRLWVLDSDSSSLRKLSLPNRNVWEAQWCSSSRIVGITSSDPGEGSWYNAQVEIIDPETETSVLLYEAEDQLGAVCASPDGKSVAVVDAVCSDRQIVAGELCLIPSDRAADPVIIDVGFDVTYCEWRSNSTLLVAGHTTSTTAVATVDVSSRKVSKQWESAEVTTGGRYVTVSGVGTGGDFMLVGEGFARAPEIAIVEDGRYRPIRSFDLGEAVNVASTVATKQITWTAPDGLEITGWLLHPKDVAQPYPLIMNIHGGPVWHWRQTWLGRSAATNLALVKAGFAVFLPNPRGSSGGGKDFARRVVGDAGGKDTQDYLSGIDHLVEEGVADVARLGVMGGSYGGFMTSWIITNDQRFSGAVSIAPHVNQITEHLLSNIPDFVKLFFGGSFDDNERYLERSPLFRAKFVRTPTLNICGALDKCTPPEEARQFHQALLEHSLISALLEYPEEGHGVVHFPAAVDYTARIVDWFRVHVLRQDSKLASATGMET